MPELPDVEIFRRHAAATSLHQEIERVQVSEERLLESTTPQALGRKLDGRQFERTLRHGKYLLLDTGESCLVLHFGMTGELRFVSHDSQLARYARAEFHFTGDGCLAYLSRRLLGQIFWLRDRKELVETHGLGPDALQIGKEEFCKRFEDRRGALKSALMDQSLLAGIGNVYSDEILFQLKLHPTLSVQKLDAKARKTLYEMCQSVLSEAIKHRADPSQMPAGFLLPKRREGCHCPRCEAELKKIYVSGRSAVICPNCQPG